MKIDCSEYPRFTLHLTLKKKWFDMILSGEKREEYREIKPYWNKRLVGKRYDAALFRNGYAKDAPKMLVEINRRTIGHGVEEWGAEHGKKYHVIKLGTILKVEGVK